MLAAIQARAFYLDPLANVHTFPDRLDCVYYSFATMSSLGAAGIIPVPEKRAAYQRSKRSWACSTSRFSFQG